MESTRVVLLGASNLTLGLPTVLSVTHAMLGPGPMDILVAAGHGRSYGQWSRVLARGLPGILGCGLWPAARRPGGVRIYALLTDIGNDLAYGASPADLAGWVSACVERLGEAGADTVLTLLPARSLARLPPWQYHLFKAVLFPGRRLPFRVLHARVAEINQRLTTLAARAKVKVVDPEARWYGPDSIHLRRRERAAAWQAILSRWEVAGGPTGIPDAARRRLPCRRMAPEWRTVLGVTLRRPQPSGVLGDGTTISLY
ncbi:MAG TPA: SGNH/GDSL hydrolase family protein [Methylomirabilota bacterium]|nr:SGNH/GDSL hydrolase family protein [Methylomirabilota bacterium]